VRIRTNAHPTLTVRERGGVVEIVAGRVVLLSSAALETEREFGALVAKTLQRPPVHVLVGGLGFGATVRGVLDVAAPNANVVVVEKVAAVEELVRGRLSRFASAALDDPRVMVEHADVVDVIAGAPAGSLDAILLDVDNGPEWASFRSNARLYASSGLGAAARTLAPGGALLVWSGYPVDSFAQALRRAGFAPSIVPLHERGKQRARAYVGVKTTPKTT